MKITDCHVHWMRWWCFRLAGIWSAPLISSGLMLVVSARRITPSFDCPSCGYRTAADRPSSNTGFALCATTSVLPDDDTATDAFWPNWGLTAIFGDLFTFYFIGLICILTNFVNYDDLMLLDTDFFLRSWSNLLGLFINRDSIQGIFRCKC